MSKNKHKLPSGGGGGKKEIGLSRPLTLYTARKKNLENLLLWP